MAMYPGHIPDYDNANDFRHDQAARLKALAARWTGRARISNSEPPAKPAKSAGPAKPGKSGQAADA